MIRRTYERYIEQLKGHIQSLQQQASVPAQVGDPQSLAADIIEQVHQSTFLWRRGRGRSSRSFQGRIMAPFLLANFLATSHFAFYL